MPYLNEDTYLVWGRPFEDDIPTTNVYIEWDEYIILERREGTWAQSYYGVQSQARNILQWLQLVAVVHGFEPTPAPPTGTAEVDPISPPPVQPNWDQVISADENPFGPADFGPIDTDEPPF